jgi:hypothetical protein
VITPDESALRAYCARILGWSAVGEIERALLSIHLSVANHAALVLIGDHDVVPIARSLHRRAIGGPFIVGDPRRLSNRPATVRTALNHESGVAAFHAALGGSLCLRRKRLPGDLPAMVALLRGLTAPRRIIICGDAQDELHPFLLRPAPIRIPPLSARANELPRIVEEYADEAIEELNAGATGFKREDHDWVIAHSASTLPEIEKGTRRLVALRRARSITGAARLLGMSHVALAQWLEHRSR